MTIVLDPGRGIIPKPLPKHANRAWRVTTDPTDEPITKAELKFYARIDGTYEDDFLDDIIKTVRQLAEEYMGRAIITQSITMSMDWWPGEQVELPRPPLIDITSIKTLGEDGSTLSTYSSDNYFTDVNSEPGKVVIKNGVTFPENNDRRQGGYQIIFRAGYGGADDVPEPIRTGLIAWATWIYENRKIISKPPEQAQAALYPYKILTI